MGSRGPEHLANGYCVRGNALRYTTLGLRSGAMGLRYANPMAVFLRSFRALDVGTIGTMGSRYADPRLYSFWEHIEMLFEVVEEIVSQQTVFL